MKQEDRILKEVFDVLAINNYNPSLADDKIFIDYNIDQSIYKAYFMLPLSFYEIPDLYSDSAELRSASGLFLYGNRLCLFHNDVIPNANYRAEIYLEVANRLNEFIKGERIHKSSIHDEIYDFWGSKLEYGYIYDKYPEKVNHCKIENNQIQATKEISNGLMINFGIINESFDFSVFIANNIVGLITLIEKFTQTEFSKLIIDKVFLGLIFSCKNQIISLGLEVGFLDYDNISTKPLKIPIKNHNLEKMSKIKLVSTDFEYLNYRSGMGNELNRSESILFIGCGSLGSVFISVFAEKGYTNFKVIDYDKLSVSNVNRHICSMIDVNKFKSDCIKEYLSNNFPNVQVDTVNENVIRYDGLQQDISKASLIVVTVGQRNIEQFIADLIGKSGKKYIISFVEPYLTAGHIIVSSTVNCFNTDLFSKNLDFEKSVLKDSNYHLREFGCTSSFNQYGFFALKRFVYQSFDFMEEAIENNENKHIMCIGDLKNAMKLGAKLKFQYMDCNRTGEIIRSNYEVHDN